MPDPFQLDLHKQYCIYTITSEIHDKRLHRESQSDTCSWWQVKQSQHGEECCCIAYWQQLCFSSTASVVHDKQRRHLWQVSCHLLGKQNAIVAFAHIVQLLKEAGCPLVQQPHHVCTDAGKAPQKHSKLPAQPV